MSSHDERHIWSINVKWTRDRGPEWYTLSDYELEYIHRLANRGLTVEQIRLDFQRKFGRRLKAATVSVTVDEGGLPQFRQVEKYKCVGCGGHTKSDPCIVCTTKKLGAKNVSGGKQRAS